MTQEETTYLREWLDRIILMVRDFRSTLQVTDDDDRGDANNIALESKTGMLTLLQVTLYCLDKVRGLI